MDGERPGPVSFRRALRRVGTREHLPGLLGALVLGGGGGAVLLGLTTLSSRHSTALDFLFVLAPLLGLVFAAFALVIALLNDPYMRWLDAKGVGVAAVLEPYLASIAIQVTAILLAVGYRAAGPVLWVGVEAAAWLVLCFLFVWALFDVVALGRGMLFHGIARARELKERDRAQPVDRNV